MATIKSTTPALPDYDYEIALDIAQNEFVELADVPRKRISFNTVAGLNGQERCVVRISESAWFAAVERQLCGGVIDILVSPDPALLPTYLAVPAEMMKEEIDILRRARSKPPSPEPPRSTPPSLAPPRLQPTARRSKSVKRSWLSRLV
ncbi:hypothetical protein C8J57DRAFT_1674501 [Mycena rebaudengoi]|nr:hypothetical protein C8J57DRAFT_1674501 [Mycena rebaudengoi]